MKTVQLEDTTHNTSKAIRDIKVILLSTLLITQFLFFIDEGYNDFRWMKSIGNWVVYFLYFGIISLGQLFFWWLISGAVLNIKSSGLRSTLFIILGTVLSLALAFTIIFNIR